MAELFVGKESEFEDRDRKIIAQGDLEIGIFRVNGDFYAYENNCVHQGGPICQGKIINRVDEVLDDERRSTGFRYVDEDVHIVCPWHGFEFNIRTGVHPGDDNTRLKGFEVELRDGAVYVRI